MIKLVEKYFEVEVCEYNPEELQEIENRLNEINDKIKVQELDKYNDTETPRLRVVYYEQADKNEMEKTITDTFQFSKLWHKCIIRKKTI